MKILALIPARGGSKRIPNKNIKPLDGKPLIAYTIKAAKQSKYINRIIVSTNSKKIAMVAKKYGAEIPFLRPKNISQCNSTELQFFKHALNWLKKNEKYEPELIVLLYPTSPFRKASSIDQAIQKMINDPRADSLRSIKLCSQHPYKMWLKGKKYLKPFITGKHPNVHTLSYQNLPAIYIQNASIYITKPKTIFKTKSPIGKIIIPFIMNEIESVDINTPLDFEYAKIRLKNIKYESKK